MEREDIVNPIKAFIKKHPVLTYYALVFAISWGGILMLVAPGGIPGEPADVEHRKIALSLEILARNIARADDADAQSLPCGHEVLQDR